MSADKLNCQLNDEKELRSLILENPGLPLLVFCGGESWSGEYPYEKAEVGSIGIRELTLYEDYWMDKDDYEEKLADDLCSQEQYRDLPDEECWRIIKGKVAEVEFVKAIVIHVG